MPFLQISLVLKQLDADAVEAACFSAGALAVSFSDAGDEPILEPALGTTPLWQATRAEVLFADDVNPVETVALLTTVLGVSAEDIETNVIPDQAWERAWLKDFHPMRFGRRLWVCPHGQEPPAGDTTAETAIVRLDPGLAFGTGTHPTTAMCLEWLDSISLRDQAVIDYGCGSGILAIAALKLGARETLCIDLDSQALIATHDNAGRNGVGDRVTAVLMLPKAQPVTADVLVANILALPLIELAPSLQALVKPGGRIALSGILVSQARAVTEAYAPWFDMQTFATRDDWVCLQGVRGRC